MDALKRFMLRTLVATIATCLLTASGCAATAEGLYECVFGVIWETGETAVFGPEKLGEDDKFVARRKGMTDNQYKQLNAEEQMLAEMRE